MKQIPILGYIIFITGITMLTGLIASTAIKDNKSGRYNHTTSRLVPDITVVNNGKITEEIYYYYPYDENNNYLNLDTTYVDSRGIRIVRIPTPGSVKNNQESCQPDSARKSVN